ncbi:hypothetical protein [Streptomyces sp. 891-h]|uniref:hypothetical protein n=1 Tax=Streptomyces sp. 891-h TaxID=2720714 RepID=UPI001FAADEE4|nr:hypothetical protein [Streptomyces sp. 891-h]
MLKETEKARADYNVDTALADGVAVVRMLLADRLGLFLQGEEAMDRIDDAVRKLIEVPRPGGDGRRGHCPRQPSRLAAGCERRT